MQILRNEIKRIFNLYIRLWKNILILNYIYTVYIHRYICVCFDKAIIALWNIVVAAIIVKILTSVCFVFSSGETFECTGLRLLFSFFLHLWGATGFRGSGKNTMKNLNWSTVFPLIFFICSKKNCQWEVPISLQDTNLDVQTLIERILRLKAMVRDANKRSKHPIDLDELLEMTVDNESAAK